MSLLSSLAYLLLELPPLQPCHSDAECPGQEQCVDFVCAYQGNEFPNCSAAAACNCPADMVCVDENCKDARIRCRSGDGTCRVEPDQVVCRCDAPASGAADPPMSGASYEACQTALASCVGEDYEGLFVEHSLPPTPAPSSPICAPGTPKQSFQSPPSCIRDSECGGAETCVSGSCALVGEGASACYYDADDATDADEGYGNPLYEGCGGYSQVCRDDYCKSTEIHCEGPKGACNIRDDEIRCGCKAYRDMDDGFDGPLPVASGDDSTRYTQCLDALSGCPEYVGPAADATDAAEAGDSGDGQDATDVSGDGGDAGDSSSTDGTDAADGEGEDTDASVGTSDDGVTAPGASTSTASSGCSVGSTASGSALWLLVTAFGIRRRVRRSARKDWMPG